MKTRFTRIASLIALSALIVTAVPVSGQRRSARNEVVKSKSVQQDNNSSKKRSNVETRASKNGNSSSSDRRTSVQNKKSASVANAPAVKRRGSSAANERKVQSQPVPGNNKPTAAQRRTPETNRSNIKNAPVRNERESFRPGNSQRYGSSQAAEVTPRARKEQSRTIYRIDSNDSRYSPASNFKGNKNSWSVKNAVQHIHYNKRDEHFYRYYDHRRFIHWDHSWETYSWNVNSWREYYNGYHPYSYRFHKHYYYHPAFGHVVRKFEYRPDHFVHNNIRYYNYNGHFFRRFSGVGYVLVDMPYGLVFQKIPRHSERVYINGYLYFRTGNLFFEKSPQGFALVHYPERYFALSTDFYNGGYYREVDYYIYH